MRGAAWRERAVLTRRSGSNKTVDTTASTVRQAFGCQQSRSKRREAEENVNVLLVDSRLDHLSHSLVPSERQRHGLARFAARAVAAAAGVARRVVVGCALVSTGRRLADDPTRPRPDREPVEEDRGQVLEGSWTGWQRVSLLAPFHCFHPGVLTSTSTRRAYLLASGGVNAEQLSSNINSVNLAGTFEPLVPLSDTDVEVR